MDSYLLLKYFKGTASAKEEAEIQKWLAEDTDGSHLETYRQMHDVFNGMTIYNDGGLSFAKVRARRRKIFTAIAAAAACVAMVFGLMTIEKNRTMDLVASKTETMSVPAGKSLMLKLDDGSTIWLNGGTEIEKPVVFGRKDRKITVRSGEIFLDVAKDANRPFYVETFASTIKVVGTRFDVQVDESESFCSVALLQGKVEAREHAEGTVIGLEPDEMLCINHGKVSKTRIQNSSAVDCWTEGLIDVSEQPFDGLMKKFEKAYNVNIVIERDTLPKVSYTRGKVRVSDGIEHALSVLQIASDFTYERDFNTNTIVIK